MGLNNFVDIQQADIVHLHYINDGFFNIKNLIHLRKPVVWTLRDMWPFTGGCHYSLGCIKFADRCGACPQLSSNNPKDITSKVLRRKKKYISSEIEVVGISNWLCEKARASSVFRDSNITMIPNCIDINQFRPIDKHAARQLFDLPTNKKIVLTGAIHPHANYKGFPEFLAAINSISASEDICVAIFGNLQQDVALKFNHEVRIMGKFSDTASLVALYNAADVFVAPSREEAFGKTLVEAMACSVPVVAFNHAGPADIVTHLETGYLAAPFDSVEMGAGILHVLNGDRNMFMTKCRERAISHYSMNVVAEQYEDLYRRMLAS
jgi:glycosyltransferase involved in cell wall biosynthesis